MEQKTKLAIRMPQSLKLAITLAAAGETIETGKTVTPSEWVREACTQRLEK